MIVDTQNHLHLGRLAGLLLLICLSAILVHAQTTSFSYQGRLTDGGTPANGTYSMQFRIFDTGIVGTGTQIGPTLTPPPVQVSAGSFTVQLDFGAGVFTGPARYLDIVVNGTPLSPRQQITSTPYAIRSLASVNADTATNATELGGVDAARFVQSDAGGNVTIGGSLTVTGTFSSNIVNAQTQYNLGGNRLLSAQAANASLFVGQQAGGVNTGAFNSFFGMQAGAANTSGIANSFFGDTAGRQNTTGIKNSAFGSGALASSILGNDNSAFGYHSGLNTTGYQNSFFGSEAGASNIAGHSNSFFGFQAGFSNTGSFNSIFGELAGLRNTTGSDNSFFGNEAGNNNASGASNAFFGRRAGFANTQNGNSFFGAFAGENNTTGDSNAFFGLAAGDANTTGSSNTFVGANAGITNTTGNTNSFFGRDAGFANTTGSVNSFFGRSAGFHNINGGNNSFFGVNAGEGNQSGNNNAFFGDSAGFKNNANNNSFFGFQAGVSNTTGAVNSFFGQGAGLSNTTGAANAFFGQSAGQNNTTASDNSFFGVSAGGDNITGNNNSYFGRAAGLNASGNANSYFGSGAGQEGNAGNDNSFFGTDAGLNNKTNNNSFFGRSAGNANTTGFQNSFFGWKAGFSNISGNINAFFGTLSGNNNTFGGGNAFFGEESGAANTTGDNNTFVGAGSGSATNASDNSFFGRSAGLSNTTGFFNTIIGAGADVGANNLTNATALGANAVVSRSDSLVLGNNANVGIGTSAPGSKLTVTGLVESTTGGFKFPDGTIQTSANAGAGPVVTSLNGLTNNVTLAAGANITITPSGNTLTIDSTGGGGGNAILNQTSLQTSANFNIDGTGTANTLNVVTGFNFGNQKILSAPGQDNLFVGIGAGGTPNLGPGTNFFENTFVGRNAGANTQFCCNAFFGGYAGESNTQGDNNTYLGYLAGQNSTTGQQNVYVGQSAGQGTSITTASFNTFVGYKTGAHNANGGNNTYLGWKADSTVGNVNFASAIGACAQVSTSDTIVIGKAAGNCTGVSRPADSVIVPGNLTVNGTFSNPSDVRLKTGVGSLKYGLNEVLRLHPVSWTWKTDAENRRQVGLLAQEVRPLLPELIVEGTDKDRLLSINYIGLLPIVIKAIQEQQTTITELRNEIAAQQKGTPGPAPPSSTESTQMTRSVNGNVVTNEQGVAIVLLPDNFEVLNQDFRYQLTVIGQFAQAIVATKISGNSFTIKTDKPNVEVSWQVTGIRRIL